MFDGRAKLAGIQFAFSAVPAGSNIPTSHFAASSWSYFFPNPDPFAGNPVATYRFSLSKVLKLPAGNYTFNILACAGSTGSTAPFDVSFGDDANYVNITAIPL